MFRSVKATIRLAVEHRLLLAFRWGLDVARGYQRAADGHEGVLRALRFGGQSVHHRTAERYADDALRWIQLQAEARAEPGPLGVGARLAMSPAEFVELRVAAENLRSEALRREQNTGAQA